MLEEGIHQPHATKLVHQGQMALRCLHRPGERAGIAGPGALSLPAELGPEPFPLSIARGQQSALHGKAEAPSGIHQPEAVEGLEIGRGDGGHFAVINVAAPHGLGSGQLTQGLTGEAIGRLILLEQQVPLQGGVVLTGSAGGGQPTTGIALHEGLTARGIGSGQQLEQPAGGPVVSRGIESVETVIDQRQQLRQPELNGGHKAAALAG